ncbi:MAG: nitroreductase family deazaflavin-dependent oxidoreductase [Chloroflexi bacterium]|nr:nitroreductase family deazaflavin-dependent oxidoreductase [Chloroflexota bacterium]
MSQSATNQFTIWHEALLKFLRKLITLGNIWALKLSRGRWGNTFLGAPVLLLTTIGRKSGKPRTKPLFYLEREGKYILVASNAGTSSDPAWLLNLKANPQVTIEVQGERRNMQAHVATDEEKAELWPHLIDMFPAWQMMEERSVRTFKVVVLEPLDS